MHLKRIIVSATVKALVYQLLLVFNVVSVLHAQTTHSPDPLPTSEEEVPVARWVYGLNLGLYIANNSTANYYNGSDPEHNLSNALNRYYNRDRIVREIDDILEDFSVYQLPENMSYSPAIQIGFFGGLNFSKSFALLGEFNYAKLNINDRFTLQTDRETFTSEPFLLLSDIFATEERIELKLGVQYTLNTSSYIHPFIESGMSITDTKIIENRARIEHITISVRNLRSDYYNVRDYGMGMGIYTGIGLNLEVSESLAVRLGGAVNFSRINIGDNREVKPQYTAFIRLNLNDVF